MRVLLAVFTVLLLLLSGCVSDDPTDPVDADPSAPAPGAADPADRGTSGQAGAAADPFEPLVFEGTVSGAADCAAESQVQDFDPMTPAAIDLPPEAAGRVYHLERTRTPTAPDAGATCLFFSDGTLRDASETDAGRVPEGVAWVQVLTNANVELEYRLTIE